MAEQKGDAEEKNCDGCRMMVRKTQGGNVKDGVAGVMGGQRGNKREREVEEKERMGD